MRMVHSIDIKKLIASCAISLGVGILSGIISMFGMESFDKANKPPLSPPDFLFPIVWTFLFLLMGISAYIIYTARNDPKGLRTTALAVYGAQLIVNFVWPIIFFNLAAYLLAFIWIVLLLIMIIIMIKLFYKISPLAGALQIPYLLWTAFATYLTLGVLILN